MKHEFTVLEDVSHRAGDVWIKGKKGATVELSDRESAIAASLAQLEYKGIVAENKSEEQFAANLAVQSADKDALLKLKKDELLQMAEGIEGVTSDNNKEEIAKKIIAQREQNNLETAPADFDTKETE